MTPSSPSPLSPESGQNLAIISTKNDGDRLVRVIYEHEATGFFDCVDVENGKKYSMYRQSVRFLPRKD